MNRRGLWTLIAVVIVLALGAALIVDSGSGTHGSSDQIGQPLLAGLTDAVTKLSRIELRSRVDTVTMVHSEDQWQVVEKGGYPVDFELLVELLDTLTEVTIVEQKTARLENHQRLGVADLDSEDSQAVVITMSTGDESVIWTLTVGDSSTGGSGGSYVRLGTDPQVWLVSHVIDVDEDPSGWIDPIITNVDSDDVDQVDVVRADGGVLTVRRKEGAENLVVDDVPDGRELRYATVANELARSLTNIRMTDVRPSAGEPWLEAHQSTYRLLDGTDVVVLARQEGEEHWLRVGRDTTTLSAWEYKVASYTFEDFSKQIEDLLKPITSAEEDGAT